MSVPWEQIPLFALPETTLTTSAASTDDVLPDDDVPVSYTHLTLPTKA